MDKYNDFFKELREKFPKIRQYSVEQFESSIDDKLIKVVEENDLNWFIINYKAKKLKFEYEKELNKLQKAYMKSHSEEDKDAVIEHTMNCDDRLSLCEKLESLLFYKGSIEEAKEKYGELFGVEVVDELFQFKKLDNYSVGLRKPWWL